MTESVLSKYIDNQKNDSERQLCLDLVRKNANRLAFPYSHLLWVNYNPSQGIQIHFSTHTVTLAGKNLDAVYEQLLQFTLGSVTEVDEKRHSCPEGEPVVTKIDVNQVAGPGATATWMTAMDVQ